jgi:hypothetical protein
VSEKAEMDENNVKMKCASTVCCEQQVAKANTALVRNKPGQNSNGSKMVNFKGL